MSTAVSILSTCRVSSYTQGPADHVADHAIDYVAMCINYMNTKLQVNVPRFVWVENTIRHTFSIMRRLLEDAMLVLDMRKADNSSSTAQDVRAKLQGCGESGVQSHFRELSKIVHPDKCILEGAQEASCPAQSQSCKLYKPVLQVHS